MTEYRLGTLAGLQLRATLLAFAGSILLLVLLSGFAIGALHLPPGQALLGSLLAVLLHWIAALAHHLGHAWAARRTGHPMRGVRFGMLGILATSLYPPDELALPAQIHIQRALGGPMGSLLFTLVTLATGLVLQTAGESLGWVGTIFFLDNLLVFGLGPFLPLGFTDGSTLLHWWRKREASE